MPVYQTINQNVVDTWIGRALADNDAFVAIHGTRFWEVSSVPSEEDWRANNSSDLFPYAFWEQRPGGREGMIQHLLPRAFIGRLRHVYSVRSVRRYEGPFDKHDFDASTNAMMQALVGVGEVEVQDDDDNVIGYIDMARFIDFDGHPGMQDGDVRTPERGILIEVIWRGVPA